MRELVDSLQLLVRLYSREDVAVELRPKLQTAMDAVIQAMQDKSQQDNRKSMFEMPLDPRDPWTVVTNNGK